MPTVWTSYVTVDRADAAVARAAELGGKILMPAMDALAAGRMAMISGPTGEVFGVWQDGNHTGAGKFNEPVSLTWNELATTDTGAAEADMRPDDIIVSLDGEPIRSMDDLILHVRRTKVGDEVTLEVWRDGEKIEVRPRPGSGHAEFDVPAGRHDFRGRLVPTRLRRVTRWLSAVAALALAVIMFQRREVG